LSNFLYESKLNNFYDKRIYIYIDNKLKRDYYIWF
jgi:hypothetical protein